MKKKLTITIDEEVYEGLHSRVGRGKISKFVENLVRPHVMRDNLNSAYKQMAKDKAREKVALEWAEATIGDSLDESW